MTKVLALATQPSDNPELEVADEHWEASPLENGDVFVADTGDYIGKWEGAMLSLPMEIAMVVDSYEYIYKLDNRAPRESH